MAEYKVPPLVPVPPKQHIPHVIPGLEKAPPPPPPQPYTVPGLEPDKFGEVPLPKKYVIPGLQKPEKAPKYVMPGLERQPGKK